jgi:hypothetical protein
MSATPRKKTPSRARPRYSQRFLANYGRNLQNEEIRLVEGYRGLSPQQQEGLLQLVSALVLDNVTGGAK